MAVDTEKVDTSPGVLQDEGRPVLHPEVTATQDGESTKEIASSADSVGQAPAQPEATQSVNPKPASVSSRTVTVVPRSKRRGLLGFLTIIPEIERPHNYANSTKWVITLIVALAGAAAPLGSAIFFREYSAHEILTICSYLHSCTCSTLSRLPRF